MPNFDLNESHVILQIMPKYQDYLVCGVSSQLGQYIPNFDEIITPNDPDFIDSGLTTSSVIRLSFLAIIPRKKVIGTIGNIAISRHQRLLQKLSDYLIGKLIIP
jgi:mRNA interferase MazF